jgi:hypothetical protein
MNISVIVAYSVTGMPCAHQRAAVQACSRPGRPWDRDDVADKRAKELQKGAIQCDVDLRGRDGASVIRPKPL